MWDTMLDGVFFFFGWCDEAFGIGHSRYDTFVYNSRFAPRVANVGEGGGVGYEKQL